MHHDAECTTLLYARETVPQDVFDLFQKSMEMVQDDDTRAGHPLFNFDFRVTGTIRTSSKQEQPYGGLKSSTESIGHTRDQQRTIEGAHGIFWYGLSRKLMITTELHLIHSGNPAGKARHMLVTTPFPPSPTPDSPSPHPFTHPFSFFSGYSSHVTRPHHHRNSSISGQITVVTTTLTGISRQLLLLPAERTPSASWSLVAHRHRCPLTKPDHTTFAE